jgi:hypothetical protein
MSHLIDFDRNTKIQVVNTLGNCNKSISRLKNIIDNMIKEGILYNTTSNTIDKSLVFINGNINTLENLFLSVDSIQTDREWRKQYVILIENSISDMNSFKEKLDRVKEINLEIKNLEKYLQETSI